MLFFIFVDLFIYLIFYYDCFTMKELQFKIGKPLMAFEEHPEAKISVDIRGEKFQED